MLLLQNDSFVSDWPASYESQQKYLIKLSTLIDFFCVFQRSVVLPSDFPSEEVFEAYLHPVVDESTELFEWGKPDLHSLRLYPLSSKLGFL